jgi:hypothetical protein
VSVAGPKANQKETVPEITSFGETHISKTTSISREILSDQGLSESWSAAEEGSYFVPEGATEVTVYYNAAGKTRDVGLLKCCRAVAQHGFALTLFLSERTSALFVRDTPTPSIDEIARHRSAQAITDRELRERVGLINAQCIAVRCGDYLL